MVEYPRVTYKEINYEDKLDEIFTKLLKYEENVSEELLAIRKEQILKHSRSVFIIETLQELAEIIGTSNFHNEHIIRISHERLTALHSPVIFNVPVNAEPFHKWEEWTFEELAAYYFDLMLMKGFEDRYVFDVSTNRTFFRGDYIGSIQNYQVIDMLNDLVIYDSKICGYEFRSFMNESDDLLDSFKHNPFRDYVIDVKTEEKYNQFELKNIIKNYPKCNVKLKEVSYAPDCMRQEFFKKR